MNNLWKRPATAADVANWSSDPESFGRNVRDWQHELRKMTSRHHFAQCIAERPPIMQDKLKDFSQCDAWLAAYVEWLCVRHKVQTPAWLDEPERFAVRPWFDYPPLWMDTFVRAPSPFRRRSVFTLPEDVLHFRKGRPHVSAVHKRQKNAERQKRYRMQIQNKLK